MATVLPTNPNLTQIEDFLAGFPGAPIKFAGDLRQFIREPGASGFNVLRHIPSEEALHKAERSGLVTSPFVELPANLLSQFQMGDVFGATPSGTPAPTPTPTPVTPPPSAGVNFIPSLEDLNRLRINTQLPQVTQEQYDLSITTYGKHCFSGQCFVIGEQPKPPTAVTTSQFFRKTGTPAVFELTPTGEVKHVTELRAQRENIFGKVQDVETLPFTLPAGFTPESLSEDFKLDVPLDIPSEFFDTGSLITSSDIFKLLQQLTPPPPPTSLVNDFEALRSAQGVSAVESQINTVKSDIRNAEADLRLVEAEIANKKVSTRVIDRETAEQRRIAQENIDFQNRRLQTLTDELNTKNGLIGQIMSFRQTDYSNASTYYANQFDRALKIIGFFQDYQNAEAQQANDAKDRALANWQVMAKVYNENGRSWDMLSPDEQVQLESLAIKAGFPGLSQFVGAGKGEVSNVTSRTDASGGTWWDVLRKFPDGRLEVESIYRGTGGGKNAPGPTPTSKTGIKASPTTLNVIEGIENINDQTPSVATTTRTELRELGFYDIAVPDWFKNGIEFVPKDFIGPLEENQAREGDNLQALWDKERESVMSKVNETSSSSSNRTP